MNLRAFQNLDFRQKGTGEKERGRASDTRLNPAVSHQQDEAITSGVGGGRLQTASEIKEMNSSGLMSVKNGSPKNQAANSKGPYFTRKLLIQAAKLGLKWDYNRQLSDRIAEVPDLKYPVIFHMPHYHRHFEPCEEHIRCMISLAPFEDAVVFCDVPVEFFKKLPRRAVAQRAA